MKKIMFNDRFHLTEMVLNGKKTMTRRMLPKKFGKELEEYYKNYEVSFENQIFDIFGTEQTPDGPRKYKYKIINIEDYATYKYGETVAIAQRYSELSWDSRFYEMLKKECELLPQYELKGWDNKMFVKSSLMPNRIRITSVRLERLQDITYDDCLKEGIFRTPIVSGNPTYSYVGGLQWDTPKEAFADLINKMSGKKTWTSNPWVFVYEFVKI